MKFNHRDPTRHPRERVFTTQRDRLLEVVPYLKGVERVSQLSRADLADGVVQIRNEWTGSPSALPLLLRPLVPPQVLVWRDDTHWDPERWQATWSMEVPAMGPAASIVGVSRFEVDGAGSAVVVEGEFRFFPERLPQAPNMPPQMTPMFEKFVVGLIVPMVRDAGRAVARFLDDQDS